MNSRRFNWLCVLVIWIVTSLIATSSVVADDADAEEVKEKTVTDRFVVVLEKNPRRGTALDKVYGYHVERGSLEKLIHGYREKAKAAKGTEAGSLWMIVGLLESLRGQDAVAVTSFEQAEKLASDNSLASYYLGLSLVLVGQPDKAAEALERSIQRKPAQADLLDVYQALGRVYQRAQKTEMALDVWNRLEKQFPNDVRVQEQIATTLLEENEFVAALPRYEGLAKTTKDKYRQSLFQMEAAEIKVRLGKSDEAIKEFESLLSQLLPENWLYREVRRRIEAVYLKTDDQAGLIAYYEAWVKKFPKDLEAISRLSRLLAGFGRSAEAQSWLENGLKIAPTKKELRHALISQFTYEHKTAEAIAQYEQLDKYEPNNPDTLREWGRLILKDKNREEGARKKEAGAIWRRMTDAKPKDALVASQVGELFRRADMVDEALELYEKAIALAPDQSQYREYLGEYFHALKRKDEALATWRTIADGKQKTAPNLARLAEVLAGFGYLTEAIETHTEACLLDPKDFSLQVKHVDLLAKADQHEEALKQLAVVKKLAANDEEREAWLGRDLRELQAAEKLKSRIVEVAKDVDGNNADQWFWLARAYEAERQMKEAAQAVTKAGTFAPQSIPILMASARIYEAQGNLMAAVEINTKLAAIDRRFRTEYLKQVATLEQKLGRRARAIQAGRDLIAAAPGNPELYEFFSQLCFQLGETEEGLGALRRSVRVNPTETKGMLLLASALTEQFRTGEAIELYWRAFDKAANLDDRLGIVPKLAELYLQTNQFDRLLERLERQRREANQQREMTICLAQAYQSVGDDGNARQELEKLLTEDTRDIQLLAQLVKLCEADGDLEAAVKFQQQVLKLVPGKDETMRLAQLLTKSGEADEAAALINRVSVDETDPESVLKSLDSMLAQSHYDQALVAVQKLIADQPKNWELMYREGVALANLKERSADAKALFEAVLALKLNDDEMSLAAKSPLKKTPGVTQSISIRGTNALMQRVQMANSFRQSVGLVQGRSATGRGGAMTVATARGGVVTCSTVAGSSMGAMQQSFLPPSDYGAARMASLGWLNFLARSSGMEAEFLKERRSIVENSKEWRELVDWYYVTLMTGQSIETYSILKTMSMRSEADVAIKSNYLRSLAGRELFVNEAPAVTASDADEDEDPLPNVAALDHEELEHVLACYKSVSEGDSTINAGAAYLQLVITELKRSGRKDEAAKLWNDALENATEASQVSTLLSGAIQRNNFKATLKILDRLATMKFGPSMMRARTANNILNYNLGGVVPMNQAQLISRLMSNRAQKNSVRDAFVLWERYVPFAAASREQRSTIAAAKTRNQPAQSQLRLQNSVMVMRANSTRSEVVDFPTANEVYDQSMIQLLRQIHAIYSDVNASKDLIDEFEKKVADATLPKDQQPLWQFGLGYLHWWLDNRDEAVSILAAATEALPDNQLMKFELARLYEKVGQPGQALEIVDSLAPTDQQAMQNREITALRMAVNSGNINRARIAAERLFGLRLDSNLQIQLAQQMHQLGMHEQAEALLARAGRQAGNKTDVLATLMQQYQSQGKNDVATQIAYQLLRRSGNKSAAPLTLASGRTVITSASGRQTTISRGGSVDGGTREQALAVLKRSGKLPEMIKKVETQLQNAPNSQRLIETLIEYATADGDDKKVAELTERMTEKKRDDPQFRYGIAQQLMQQGKHKEAIEHFQAAFAKDPRILRNQYSQIVRSYQTAGMSAELAKVLESIDLSAFPENFIVVRYFIQSNSRDEKSNDISISLFKKAWKEVPEQRQQLIASLNSDALWQMPEIYDYAREGIFPSASTPTPRRNYGWVGFGQIQNINMESRGGDPRINTLVNRFLNIAEKNKKLDELANQIEESLKMFDAWEGGQALLGLVNLRRGRIEEGKSALEATLASVRTQPLRNYIPWEIAQELMEHESCIDLAIQYLEVATKDSNASMNGIQSSPYKPLVALYKRRNRFDDARRAVISASKVRTSGSNGNDDYEAYQRIQGCAALGNELKAMGFPMDAIRVYQEQLGRSEDFTAMARVFSANTGTTQADLMRKSIETNFQKALKELKPEMLCELLTGPTLGKTGTEAVSALEPANAVGEPLNLLLMLESRDLDKTEMSSALGKLVSDASATPDMIAKTKAALAEVRAMQPDDFGLRILAIQLSVREKAISKTSADIMELVELVDKTPLDPLPAKGGFTLLQRQAALQQVALWLVARECLKQESLRASGTHLAERALEAARRQVDNGFAMAILREWGQLALDAGDAATAEQRWTEMLEAVISKPTEKVKKKE